MCGICGYFGEHAAISGEHLGADEPDADPTWTRRGRHLRAYGVGLAMRRLSIIDLGGGRQPIRTRTARYGLSSTGRSTTTANCGPSCSSVGTDSGLTRTPKLSSTSTRNTATTWCTTCVACSRSPYGTLAVTAVLSPETGSESSRCSMRKSATLCSSARKSRPSSPRTLSNVTWITRHSMPSSPSLTYPAPLTIYRAVRKLEPGHLLTFESGRVEKRCYWDFNVANPERETNEAAVAGPLRG